MYILESETDKSDDPFHIFRKIMGKKDLKMTSGGHF